MERTHTSIQIRFGLIMRVNGRDTFKSDWWGSLRLRMLSHEVLPYKTYFIISVVLVMYWSKNTLVAEKYWGIIGGDCVHITLTLDRHNKVSYKSFITVFNWKKKLEKHLPPTLGSWNKRRAEHTRSTSKSIIFICRGQKKGILYSGMKLLDKVISQKLQLLAWWNKFACMAYPNKPCRLILRLWSPLLFVFFSVFPLYTANFISLPISQSRCNVCRGALSILPPVRLW